MWKGREVKLTLEKKTLVDIFGLEKRMYFAHDDDDYYCHY